MKTYIKGIKIEISVYFATLITLAFALSPNGSAPVSFVCCLLHEVGHLVAMKTAGCRVKGIAFGLYGMRIDCANGVFLSHSKEALIAFCGPFVNILLTLTGIAVKSETLFMANIVLAVFNLFPVESTDGYNILKNLLLLRFDGEKIKAALKIVSAAFLFLVYLSGFMLLIKSRYNFSALAVAVYLTIRFLFQENRPYR